MCSADGKIFRPKMKVKVNPELLQLSRSGLQNVEGKRIHDFFLTLATCNTIVPLVVECWHTWPWCQADRLPRRITRWTSTGLCCCCLWFYAHRTNLWPFSHWYSWTKTKVSWILFLILLYLSPQMVTDKLHICS